MLAIDSREALVLVDDPDPSWLLELVADSEVQARIVDRRKLHHALQWCHLHLVDDVNSAAVWSHAGGDLRGIERTLGGEGVPMVREFVAEAFAAALGVSTRSGMQLMADAMELHHRLPRVDRRVQDLTVAPWRARRIAQATTSLSPAAAAYVDEQLAPIVDRCGATRIDKTVANAIALFDPVETEQVEDEAEETWGVHLQHGVGPTWSGTSTMQITGDTPTLTRFHDLLCETAHGLLDPQRDDDPDLVHRKITALGMLCDQHGAQGAGRSTTAATKVFVHVDAGDLDHDGPATGHVEKLGALTLARIKRWLEGSRVVVLPVLDLARAESVDRHDPPLWMHELVVQRDPTCVFPWCHVDSRRCDLDHTVPYVPPDEGGPLGQTRPDNLAPLCRRHHRAKTFTGWRYRRNPDGTCTWTDPTGATYATGQVRGRSRP